MTKAITYNTIEFNGTLMQLSFSIYLFEIYGLIFNN